MSPTSSSQKHPLDDQAIANFQEYLRIPSVQPNVNYDPCVSFLQKQADGLGLPMKVFTCVPKKPIVVITWVGSEPNVPSILLSSHMDVVPVYEEMWTHKPFGADIDDKNNIYARGTQDMKSVGIQYLEAIRRLKQQGVKLKRTIHLCFTPDEEIGSIDGAMKFAKTKDFNDLNVGFALDEGMASPIEEFVLFNGERAIWNFYIHCPGTPGHGSLLLDGTAGEKVAYLLNKFFAFREGEKNKLKNDPSLTIGDVTTINLTQMRGGVQTNVVPPQFTIAIDCRIPPTSVDIVKWEETINQWCREAGSDITIEYEQKGEQIPATKIDGTNPYWVAFKEASDKLGLKLKPQIFPGATDSRYFRGVGVPALGFSPMNNTPVLLHDHDEFLGVETFLKGIEIYCEIIKAVANVADKTG